MLRLNAFGRSQREVDELVLNYSPWDHEQSCWTSPTCEELMRWRIVVSTLNTAGKLFNKGIPPGHFDLIVIDEAAQATEPEVMASVGTLWKPGVQLVLGGDPKQLGPVIHNSSAKAHGLATSLLERLMQRPLYSRRGADDAPQGGYDRRVLTKLVQNFRAHPALLEVPNERFYGSQLVACADDELKLYCAHWERLPTAGVPLIFHGVCGKDMREQASLASLTPKASPLITSPHPSSPLITSIHL